MIYHQKPLTYVGQVELKVENLERSVSFYQEIIGFKLFKKEKKRQYLPQMVSPPFYPSLSLKELFRSKMVRPVYTTLPFFYQAVRI